LSKRVVITGLGVVSPVGNNVHDFWTSIISGKSGISKITRFYVAQFDCQIAGEVNDLDLEAAGISHKEARRLSRFIKYASVAALEAVKDSGLDISKDANEIGVHIGSGIGGIEVLEEQKEILLERGPGRCSPFTVPMMITDMASGQVAIMTGAKGPNASTVTACASGTHSIGDAFRMIDRGDAVAMICGGAEAAITPLSFAGFCAAQALSTTMNENPLHASRPFDAERDGFVMGEGSGVVILEELEHAKARRAKSYAEIVGYGSTGDAYHITAPAADGNGGYRAMQTALKRAGLNPSNIDYVNAHGTSTPIGDQIELSAVKRLFGDAAYDMAMSSTKSAIGHLLGAAGAVEAIFSILAIKNNIVPPTLNLDNPSEGCDLNLVPHVAQEREVRHVLSNSFGFGGTNASLVISEVV